jgi:hypothetical protein
MILCGMLDFCRLLFGIVIDLFRPRGPRPGRHRGRAFLQFLFMLVRARRVRARRSAGTRRRGVLARGGLARAVGCTDFFVTGVRTSWPARAPASWGTSMTIVAALRGSD